MKKIEVNGISYEVVREDNDCINLEELQEKMTDYFEPYDYVLGDYAYEKLRLKGYYDEKNKKVTEINNIKNIENYIKDYCSYGAKIFLLKKIKEKRL